MDPITMMVASIGMQFFNNYANNDKNKEIQDKQREFQKAATEHDFERMRKLQAESAKLALELEAEVHKERAEDINSNYDALLENFAHSFAIQNWPLNVLPFVMKGESFGSLFKGTTKSVNMHCIFTPSNCDWFNRMFYDDIDLRLEAEMNNNWNAQTTHPIVYYGGGWNRRTVLPHGISIPNLIDLDDIGLLETNLKNVPVMVVTPYFDPWLHFRVKIWGMGKDSEVPFRIDIPHGADIDISKRIFSYDYNKDMKEEMTEDFINTTIEEFVPYLECLIGFVADKYFGEVYYLSPHTLALCSSIEKLKYIYIRHFCDKCLYLASKRTNSIQNLYCSIRIFEKTKEIDGRYVQKYLDVLHASLLETIGGYEGLTKDYINCLSLIRDLSTSNSIKNKIVKELYYITSNSNKLDKELSWEINQQALFKYSDFLNWLETKRIIARSLGAKYTIVLLRNGFFMSFFVDSRINIICSDSLSGVCVVGNSQIFPNSHVYNNVLAINLETNSYENFSYMDQKHFNSFERLGKQLDALVNNLGQIPRSVCPRPKQSPEQHSSNGDNLEKQLAQVFLSANSVLLETENKQIASFEEIKTWISSKLPVLDAKKAHIFSTIIKDKKMVCVFFSDSETRALVGDKYPLKRIMCTELDTDLEAFLNGLSIGTINL